MQNSRTWNWAKFLPGHFCLVAAHDLGQLSESQSCAWFISATSPNQPLRQSASLCKKLPSSMAWLPGGLWFGVGACAFQFLVLACGCCSVQRYVGTYLDYISDIWISFFIIPHPGQEGAKVRHVRQGMQSIWPLKNSRLVYLKFIWGISTAAAAFVLLSSFALLPMSLRDAGMSKILVGTGLCSWHNLFPRPLT